MMLRMLTVGLVLASMAPAALQASDRLVVTEVADGVWMHTTWHEFPSGARFPGNGLLVRDGDGLVLVDTAWGEEATAELLDWIDAELALPVVRAIVTHFHDDSLGGIPVLAARGIPVLGHPLTSTLAGDTNRPQPEPLGSLEAGTAVRVANVEVHYPGPAHSADNLVVWVPHARVLFGGCAVRTPEFGGRGNVADADLGNWAHAIGSVRDRYHDAAVVVPGHGAPGDVSLLDHTISLFDSGIRPKVN